MTRMLLMVQDPEGGAATTETLRRVTMDRPNRRRRPPKFVGRSRGPLTERDHEQCVLRLGRIYGDMERLFHPFGFLLRGRMQNFNPGQQVPCV